MSTRILTWFLLVAALPAFAQVPTARNSYTKCPSSLFIAHIVSGLSLEDRARFYVLYDAYVQNRLLEGRTPDGKTFRFYITRIDPTKDEKGLQIQKQGGYGGEVVPLTEMLATHAWNMVSREAEWKEIEERLTGDDAKAFAAMRESFEKGTPISRYFRGGFFGYDLKKERGGVTNIFTRGSFSFPVLFFDFRDSTGFVGTHTFHLEGHGVDRGRPAVQWDAHDRRDEEVERCRKHPFASEFGAWY